MRLKDTIETTRNRLKNKAYPNERAIRQCIVDPILNDLGWATLDPQSVYPEYPVEGSKKADYALCYPALDPCAFIEVKEHHSRYLKAAEKQVLGYTSHSSVSIAIVTDGERWRFFYPAEGGMEKDCKVRELNLIIDDILVSAECLEKYLSYETIKTGVAHKAMKQDAENRHVAKYSQTQLCQIIAQRCWDEERSIKYLAADLNVEVNEVRNITKMAEYLEVVENLIMTTRSLDQLIQWIEKRKPSNFGKRMNLPEEADASRLIKKVRDNLCTEVT